MSSITNTVSPKRRPRTPPHLLEFTQTLSPSSSVVKARKSRSNSDVRTHNTELEFVNEDSNEVNGTLRRESSPVSPKHTELLSKEDIEATMAQVEAPMRTLNVIRTQLDQLGESWAQLGSEIEQLSHQKGVGEQASQGLALWGGMSYMNSVQHEVLSRFIDKSVELPVRKVIDQYNEQRKRLDEQFQVSYHDLVRQLRAAERTQRTLTSSKTRNIAIYRSSLEELASNLDTIDALKREYYSQSANLLQTVCSNVNIVGARMVRLQLEMSANIAEKKEQSSGLDVWIGQVECNEKEAASGQTNITEEEEEEEEEEEDENNSNASNIEDANLTLQDPIKFENLSVRSTETQEQEETNDDESDKDYHLDGFSNQQPVLKPHSLFLQEQSQDPIW